MAEADLCVPCNVDRTCEAFDESPNAFHCISLDLQLPKHMTSVEHFELRLQVSLSLWKAAEVRAVNVKVPDSQAEKIPLLLKHNFEFHHAKPGYAQLLKWLSEAEPNNYPSYANHYVGVGGFVVNHKNQVLVIKERFSDTRARWKLPGGGADIGEELQDVARREVLEETGVESEFLGMLCFRHMHNFRYGCADLYFVCLMRAVTTEIKACQQEISECCWMDLDEFSAQDLHATNRYIYESYLKAKETGVFLNSTAVANYDGSTVHSMFRPESNDSLSRLFQ